MRIIGLNDFETIWTKEFDEKQAVYQMYLMPIKSINAQYLFLSVGTNYSEKFKERNFTIYTYII